MNILNVESGIICHQVNAMGKMGAGLALDIRKKWPNVYRDYMIAYNEGNLKLGNVIFTKIENCSIIIASCVGQKFYGRKGKHTIYKAIEKCFEKVEKKSNELKLPVYIPYKIGCGLAGGNWKVVKEIIEGKISNSIICRKG